jgi:hypothetical protein
VFYLQHHLQQFQQWLHIKLRYIKLHYTKLHYTKLHYTKLRCIVMLRPRSATKPHRYPPSETVFFAIAGRLLFYEYEQGVAHFEASTGCLLG